MSNDKVVMQESAAAALWDYYEKQDRKLYSFEVLHTWAYETVLSKGDVQTYCVTMWVNGMLEFLTVKEVDPFVMTSKGWQVDLSAKIRLPVLGGQDVETSE